MMNVKNASKFALSALLSAILAGCGADVSNDLNSGRSSSSGMLTLSVTDAAVDSAAEVWVEFTGVELQPETGERITIDFDSPVSINLLSLQGSLSQDFFSNTTVASGTYSWVRLKVNASLDGTFDSYIKLDDGNMHELDIPSGSQTGLKINTPFEVNGNAENAFTVDFDLRKSVVLTTGEYKLKPVLRLVDNSTTNTVDGTVDATLASDASCSDSDPLTGNAVYLFEGHDITPDDMDNINPDPVTTALLTLDSSSGMLQYEIGFVPAGNYTIAFTCQADLDNPETNDAITFSLVSNITVTAPLPDISDAIFNR